MKLGLLIACLAALALTWCLISTNATIHQQAAHIRELETAQVATTRRQEFAAQADCAAAAHRFVISRGWKPDAGDDYENHFNSKLNQCFVLVSSYMPKDDFRTFDLYDALEGRHYATYNGHNNCEVAFMHDPKRCVFDSGSVWFDGNDTKSPPDFSVGFRGLRYGGGSGDENTQKTFLDRVHAFMNQ
jgi:hypothetical protein